MCCNSVVFSFMFFRLLFFVVCILIEFDCCLFYVCDTVVDCFYLYCLSWLYFICLPRVGGWLFIVSVYWLLLMFVYGFLILVGLWFGYWFVCLVGFFLVVVIV